VNRPDGAPGTCSYALNGKGAACQQGSLTGIAMFQVWHASSLSALMKGRLIAAGPCRAARGQKGNGGRFNLPGKPTVQGTFELRLS